jgi:hypothetical protein
MDRHRHSSLVKFSNLFLIVAALIFAASLIQFIPRKSLEVVSSLSERNLAIDKAKNEGSQGYSFNTSFIPGVGPANQLNTGSGSNN